MKNSVGKITGCKTCKFKTDWSKEGNLRHSCQKHFNLTGNKLYLEITNKTVSCDLYEVL